jgi:hypothetical protein
LFKQKYGRKRQPGRDPNDRRYDGKIRLMLRRIDPVEFDALTRGEEEIEPAEQDP